MVADLAGEGIVAWAAELAAVRGECHGPTVA